MIIQKIKLERLNPAAYNPRKDLKPGDKEYEQLKRSITEYGCVEPVVWNKSTGNIVGGHQRYKILRDMGEPEIECAVVELEPQREKALNVALNKIQGAWDEIKLAELVAGLDADAFDVSLTGFDADEVDALLNKFYSKAAVQDAFDVDKAKAEVESSGAVTRRGDIWVLGRHRLMCGDSTSAEDFLKLLEGAHAQVAVTSPPYGVGKEYEEAGIAPWLATMRPAIKNICRHADIVCWNLGDMLVTGTQFIEPTNAYSVQLFAEHNFRPIWIRVWNKRRQALSEKAPYHLSTNKPVTQYEFITAFSSTGEREEYDVQEFVWVSAFAAHGYRFVKRLTREERKNWGYSGIWDITSVNANKEHPAMFPVELPWRCVKMHSDRDGVVLEPFSGSGTTLIACEQTDRRCYAMELSPVYCDLAVKRWEAFTGEQSVRLEGVRNA
jgi:DNA modification methylase